MRIELQRFCGYVIFHLAYTILWLKKHGFIFVSLQKSHFNQYAKNNNKTIYICYHKIIWSIRKHWARIAADKLCRFLPKFYELYYPQKCFETPN
jgi:hypothetical protein